MKNKKTFQFPAFSAGKLILGVLSVILTFSLIVQVAMGISTIRDVDYVSRYQDEEAYLSDLKYGDYLYLLDLTNRDSRLDKEYSETTKACRAVAYYFEAASLYRAYTDAGNAEAAAKQAARMETYAAQTGEFSGHMEKINERFEIE